MQVYGIDLAKEKFDVNYLNLKGKVINRQVKNELQTIVNFLEEVPVGSVICAEHTGVYGDLLESLSVSMNIRIALVPGYTIKHSLGMQKGKDDKLDAERIREYGERFFDKLSFSICNSEAESELSELYTYRRQLVKKLSSIKTSREGRVLKVAQSIVVQKSSNKIQQVLEKEIKAIEKEMEEVVRQDKEMKRNIELIRTILGVGPVIATDLVIKTGNFKRITTAKKTASYAGICPFPNQSGKYKGNNRNSHLGDKKLKTLLFLGAKAAATHNPVLSLYFKRKMLEGKDYYLIMNNISNKLLKMIFAIVESGEKYDISYIQNDPRNDKKVA